MGGCVTQEQAILHAQYLDLIYSRSGTLYDVLPDVPRPSSDLMTSKSSATPHVDGVIGSVTHTPAKSSSKQKMVSNTASISPSQNSSGLGKTLEVHIVQSTAADKSLKGKKKGKAKGKSDAPKQGPPKPSAGDAS